MIRNSWIYAITIVIGEILFTQEWKDEKLTWDTGEYNGLEMMRIPCRKLWLPDIVLYNR